MIDFRSFLISSICNQYCKISSKHCFHCIPHILIGCAFILIQYKLPGCLGQEIMRLLILFEYLKVSLEISCFTHLLFKCVLLNLPMF